MKIIVTITAIIIMLTSFVFLWGVTAGSRKMKDAEREDLEQEQTVSSWK